MQTTSAVRALGTLQISAWCMFSPFLSHPVVGEDCMILHLCVKTGWSGGPAILAKMLPSTFWHLCCWSRSAPENRREWEWIASPVFMSVALVLNQMSPSARKQPASWQLANKQASNRSSDQSINRSIHINTMYFHVWMKPCHLALHPFLKEWLNGVASRGNVGLRHLRELSPCAESLRINF